MTNLKRTLRSVTCLTALTAGLLAVPALAQEAPVETVPDAVDTASRTMDKVVITGSRIRRSNETAAIPVQILGRDDIEEIGTVNVGEILTEIPGVDFDLSPESTGLSTQNAGLSTINLRRLGGNRTLTLIDGRRAVSNSGNGERVSVQTVPAGFVQSVEITTGGASAIYGSDAIAGVANIILKDNFEGFEANLRYSDAERSGEQETTLDLTYGTTFAGGRGYGLFGLTYNDETAIFADSSRPESLALVEFNAPNTGSGPGTFADETGFGNCDDSGAFCINPSGSTLLPGGRFEAGDAWNVDGVWYNDQSLLFPDGRPAGTDFETDVDGYNFRPGRTLSPSVESFVAGMKVDFELSSDVDAFIDITYADINTLSRNAPLTASNTTDIGFNNSEGDIGSMPSDHPFIPPEVEETRSGTVSWGRRFTEVGFRDKDNERNTLRSAFGLEGKTANDWQWTAYMTFGKFDQTQTHINELSQLNIRNALDIESDGGTGFQCADADARADGCVPLNIFGTGSISAEAADYIRYTGILKQERTQKTFAASMNGELFSWQEGPVSAAFGIEHRIEEQETNGDPDNINEFTSITHIPDITADFDVTEVFAELDVPLIADTLSLQLAARAAEYSTVGEVFSYNIGGSWQPIDDIRIRAQYSRSQRAPTLTEFFSPPRGDFDALRDPCDGLNADGTGITVPTGSPGTSTTIAANCLAEVGIQAFFADPANAGDPFEFDGSVSGPNAGNVNLEEETADTFTIGTIFTPSFIPDLSIIVDYYDISVKDAIGSVSTQLTADLCYSDADFPNNRFCDVITRDASDGSVTQIINQQENLNEMNVEGIDATINYAWGWDAVPGEFDASLIYTHYLSDDFTFVSLSGSETESALGEIGSPDNEFRAKLGWENDNVRATYTVRHRDGGVDDNGVGPTDDEYFSTGSEAVHSLFAQYTFRDNPSLKLYGGVNNIFDELGPVLPTGLNYGNTRNIVSSLNNVAGREYYAGVRLRF